MWSCNICFKTFDRSTNYFNHHQNYKYDYEISNVGTSLNEEDLVEKSIDEFYLNGIFNYLFKNITISLKIISKFFFFSNQTEEKYKEEGYENNDEKEGYNNDDDDD